MLPVSREMDRLPEPFELVIRAHDIRAHNIHGCPRTDEKKFALAACSCQELFGVPARRLDVCAGEREKDAVSLSRHELTWKTQCIVPHTYCLERLKRGAIMVDAGLD